MSHEIRRETMAETLFNRYEVIEVLRATDRVTSYKVIDRTGARAFLKTVRADPTQADEDLRNLRRLMTVKHPQVASPTASEATEDGYYFVREWVDGAPLQPPPRGALDPDAARGLTADMCVGVGAIHAAGLAHGNLGPTNVIRKSDGVTVVVDGGVRRRTDFPEGAPSEHGRYVSPEQARGMPTRPPADVYVLGVMLYELLTGRHPFEAPDAVSVVDSHRLQSLPTPSSANEAVPVHLDGIVAQSTAKAPEQRYPDATAMRRALAAVPGTGRRSAWRWSLVAAVAALAVLAILLAVVLLSDGGEVAPVPDVTGTPVQEAETALVEAGFEPGDLTEEATTEVRPGVVLSQDPLPGEEAELGSGVALTVSAIPTVEIPDVTGASEAEATARLGQNGLRIGSIAREESEDVEPGFVMSQEPPAGETAPVGQEVNLVVSQGPARDDGAAVVPNVVGLEEETAAATLEAAGFSVRSREVESTQPAGVVVSQEPNGGSEVEAGIRVGIEISEGPPEQTTVPDLVGLNVLDAWRTLREAGLDTNYEWVREGAPYLEVLTQEPAPGTTLNQGHEVRVTVSIPSLGALPGLGGDEGTTPGGT